MNRVLWLPVVSAAVALASVDTFASEQLEISLGLAVNSSPLYIGSSERELYVFPIVEATYHIDKSSKLFVGSTNGFGVEKTISGFAFGLGIAYRYGLYGPSDFGLLRDKPEILAGMDDPDDTETIKPFIRTVNETWNFKLEYEEGLQKKNRGSIAKLGLSYDYYASEKLFGKVGTHATWSDAQFTDDYFGISGKEVTASRAQYLGKSGLYNYGLSAEVNYLVDPQNVLFASVLGNVLSDEVKKSSIVKEEVQAEVTLAYIHFF